MIPVKIFLFIKLFSVVQGSYRGCKPEEFPCNNGQCIEKLFWCDDKIHCQDKSDETYCRETYETTDGRIVKDPNVCSRDRNLFLCLDGRCIPRTGRCDGYNSCSDGSDEIRCEKGSILDEAEVSMKAFEPTIKQAEDYVDDSEYFIDLHYEDYERALSSARSWLLYQQDQHFGWGDYTPRAIVALALSKTSDSKKDEKELLMDKQLDIQLSIALTRNQSKSIPLSELALYINSLMATCSNPRNFYGFDLVTALRERVDAALPKNSFVSPLVFLTLCMNNKTSYNDIYGMQKLLRIENHAANRLDVLSLASLALSCIIKIPNYAPPQYRRNILQALLNKLENVGLPGNIYELSLVVQALNEARVDPRKWKREEAMNFILNKQNENGSFGDILATYYVMPILSGNSMLSLANHCEKDFSKGLIPLEILKNSKKEKITVPYSLYFGQPVEMSQKIEIKVAQGTSFLDVMRLAQAENLNFRFKLDDTKTVPFVYSIGGIPNDAERGLYWYLYVSSQRNRSDLIQYNDDVRRHIPRDGEGTVFWLRSV